MIVLAFFGAFLVLMVVAAMFYDRRVRRRGSRPGVSERELLKRDKDLGL
jgi:membrane protein implicated in regulation of membrane protease activity